MSEQTEIAPAGMGFVVAQNLLMSVLLLGFFYGLYHFGPGSSDPVAPISLLALGSYLALGGFVFPDYLLFRLKISRALRWGGSRSMANAAYGGIGLLMMAYAVYALGNALL